MTAMTCVLAASTGIAAGDLENELALHLPLTGDLQDHSSHHHDIEVVGRVELREQGAWFGGRKDWLEAPFVDLNQRPFAIALWLKETTLTREVGLIEQFGLSRRGQHLHLMLRQNRQPYFGTYGRDLISPVSVPRGGEWMHLVFQYTGEFQQIWVDGRLIASKRTEPYRGNYGVTAIGKSPRWGNVPSKDFVGYLRDVRIYQRTLAVEEITRLSEPFESPGDRRSSDGSDNPSKPAEKTEAEMAAYLPEDPGQPFLEIDGHRVTVNGRPGQIYILQATTDFESWANLGQSTNTNGRVVYEEQPDAPDLRFYRVLVRNGGIPAAEE